MYVCIQYSEGFVLLRLTDKQQGPTELAAHTKQAPVRKSVQEMVELARQLVERGAAQTARAKLLGIHIPAG